MYHWKCSTTKGHVHCCHVGSVDVCIHLYRCVCTRMCMCVKVNRMCVHMYVAVFCVCMYVPETERKRDWAAAKAVGNYSMSRPILRCAVPDDAICECTRTYSGTEPCMGCVKLLRSGTEKHMEVAACPWNLLYGTSWNRRKYIYAGQ